ncbi:MAG: helix-turn-helix domain-containing protein [Clostridia bacterium]
MRENKKNNIGIILKEYRLKNGYTQEDVSELTGLAPRYISQIERGLSNGSLETLIKFCNAYKITPNHLLSNFLDSPEDCSYYNSIANYEKLNSNNKYVVDRLIEILLDLQEKK